MEERCPLSRRTRQRVHLLVYCRVVPTLFTWYYRDEKDRGISKTMRGFSHGELFSRKNLLQTDALCVGPARGELKQKLICSLHFGVPEDLRKTTKPSSRYFQILNKSPTNYPESLMDTVLL